MLEIQEGGSQPVFFQALRRSPVDENGNFNFASLHTLRDQFRSGVGQIEWNIEKRGSAQVSPSRLQITGRMSDIYIGIVSGNSVLNGVYTVDRQWEFSVLRRD